MFKPQTEDSQRHVLLFNIVLNYLQVAREQLGQRGWFKCDNIS